MTPGLERHGVDVPGGRVALALHLPAGSARVPCVLACHGLGASKDSEKYLLLGETLPAAGIALARFDFRGCGESTGAEDETTIATRIEDAECVLAMLAGHPRLTGALGLLGSSMGGFVALHLAARRGDGTPVTTWNAPGDLFDLANEERADTHGIGVPFFMELASHQYDTTPSGVPRHLVIHGDADDVVPVDHGVVLHARAAEPCDLVIIPGADHRITDPAHRRQAVELSLAWFQKYLQGADR